MLYGLDSTKEHPYSRESAAELNLAVDGTGRVFLTNVDAVLSHRLEERWRPELAAPDSGGPNGGSRYWWASIAAAGRGRALVTFSGPDGDVAIVRRPGGTWTPPRRFRPQYLGNAVMARDGTALVSAAVDSYRPNVVDVARYEPSTGWMPTVTISREAGDGGATVVCGPDGNAVLFYYGPGDRLRASYRSATPGAAALMDIVRPASPNPGVIRVGRSLSMGTEPDPAHRL